MFFRQPVCTAVNEGPNVGGTVPDIWPIEAIACYFTSLKGANIGVDNMHGKKKGTRYG